MFFAVQIAELSGPAASLLSTLSASQVSTVVEALGKAGVKDAELFGKISTQVSIEILNVLYIWYQSTG